MIKTFLTAVSCITLISVSAQIETPQPSPSAKISQSVGLNTIDIEYSRPYKRDRVIFGDLVPFDKMWRTGANKNTILTTSDVMIFGKDTLQAGRYAIFAKPMKGNDWEMYFYTDTENWGTPEKWDASRVAVKTMATSRPTKDVVESFTISIDNVDSDAADLSFAWDKTKATVSFIVPTIERVAASIKSVMAGPSTGDDIKQLYAEAEMSLTDLEFKEMDEIDNLNGPEGYEKALLVVEKYEALKDELYEKYESLLDSKKTIDLFNLVYESKENRRDWMSKARKGTYFL